MALLYLAQSINTTDVQSAQLLKFRSMQQLLILHHDALTLSLQPGHLPFKYDRQAPQYKPQKATRFLSAIISFCVDVFIYIPFLLFFISFYDLLPNVYCYPFCF